MNGESSGLVSRTDPNVGQLWEHHSRLELALPAALISGGLTASLLHASEIDTWWAYALVAACLAGFSCFLPHSVGKWGLAATSLVAIVGLLALATFVPEQLGTFVNSYREYRTESTGYIHSQVVASGGIVGAVLIVLLIVSCVVLFTVYVSWATLLLALACVLAYASDFLARDYFAAAVLLGFAFLALMKIHRSSDARGGNVSFLHLPHLVVAGIGAALVVAVAGMQSVEPLSKELRYRSSSLIDNVANDSPTQSMPEGDFHRLGSWQPSEQEVLEVSAAAPKKTYLRNYVGEVYENSRFVPLDPAERVPSEDTFYWLHQEGFYGHNSSDQAARALGESKTSELGITKLSVDEQSLLAPYGLATEEHLNPRFIGDGYSRTQDQNLKFDVSDNSLPQWFELQRKISEAQGSNRDVDAYLVREQAYRDYVYEHYLQVPDDALLAVDTALDLQSDTVTLSEAKNAVLNALDKNLEYSEAVNTAKSNTDFISYVLGTQRKGYSVHYASTATLMLRYMGIPARYVEGYFLSAQDAESLVANQPFTISEKKAHAWTEYYLDGVGWLPFEVTPGYIDDEESLIQATIDNPESANEQLGAQLYSGGYEARVRQLQLNSKDPQTSETSPESSPVPTAAILLFLLLLIIAGLIAWVFIRRRKLKRFLKRIDMAERNEATALRFAYALRLLTAAGLQPEIQEKDFGVGSWLNEDPETVPLKDLSEGAARARIINLQARFSSSEVSEADEAFMRNFASDSKEVLVMRSSLLQKARDRLIHPLY